VAILTALFDVHVIDYLADHRDDRHLLQSAQHDGRVRLLSTHLLADELKAIPLAKAERYGELEMVRVRLRFETVNTHGFVLDVSRLNGADMIGWDELPDYEALTTDNSKHAEDALLALTAREHEAVFVTTDRRAMKRAQDIGVDVATPQEFMRRVWRVSESDPH